MSLLRPRQQGTLGRIADFSMVPIMYLLQGNVSEVPQRTHFWNNLHLKNVDAFGFDAALFETVSSDPSATRRWLGPLPLFHMAIFGGWKQFVVVVPKEKQETWFVGWIAGDAFGLSQIPLVGPVRLGVGPAQAQFFGITIDGRQIDIDIVGYGSIGKAGKFAKIPLL